MYKITLTNHETTVIPMMQGDTDYQIEVTLVESLQYRIATVDVNTISGNVLQIGSDDVTIDTVNNTITFTVDHQTTALAGQYKAQICVYSASDPSKLVNYYPLILNVEKAVKPIESPYETAVAKVTELVNEGYKLAESWAHGKTGVRDGEDTDNSMYYAQMAKTAYEDISDTNEAKLSNRVSAIEMGYTINQIYLGKINHGLNMYPTVDGYIGKYGAGISTDCTAGGTDNRHVSLYWIADDLDNISVYVDKHVIYDDDGVQLEVDDILQVDSMHYVVLFKDGATQCLQVVLSTSAKETLLNEEAAE